VPDNSFERSRGEVIVRNNGWLEHTFLKEGREGRAGHSESDKTFGTECVSPVAGIVALGEILDLGFEET
jgi:hypothetical protein